jgi:RNA methyltransferase, TrmH family
MLSKNKIKFIRSLNRKKERDETALFLAEGNKMAEEALHSMYIIETLICTQQFAEQYSNIGSRTNELIIAEKEEIQKASLLQNPQDAMVIVRKPENKTPALDLKNNLSLALDFIQDPGNLGTIIRIADWFGLSTIICSENTVDIYNPKVVQASMGAIFRTNCRYTNLEKFLSGATKMDIPVYGTFMNGANIYTENLTKNGIVVMGNEGNGISPGVAELVTHKIAIPSFSSNMDKSESLNVAVAAAICCSEFKRR